MKRTLVTVMSLLMITALGYGYSGGPPAGKAGNMGSTCTQCHSSFPLNSGDGSLVLDVGALTEYMPNETYTFTVELEDPGQQRWGFQIAAEDEQDNFAGSWTITDPTHTQLNQTNYVNHTSTGTYNGEAMGSWSFDWTAPPEGTGEVTFYIAGNAANGNFNTSGDYIYNTQLVLMEASVQPPFVFTTDPVNSTIPAAGGTLDYTVQLTTTLPNSYAGVTYWTRVELPNGNLTPVLNSITATIPAFADISAQLSQDVPGFAPAGQYQHISYLGFYPNDQTFASFGFEKLAGNAADGFAVHGWDARGDLGQTLAADDEFASLPAAYELQAAYPNPFNGMTTVRVALPETANLNVRVFNVLGETVATLSDGAMAAGEHAFSFQADGMSSGVYFISAQVPGELNAMQKVTLVK